MEIILAILVLIEVLTTVGVSVWCAYENNPFYPVITVWENTEEDLNIVGRIIAVTIIGIITLPAMLINCSVYLVLIVFVGIYKLFKFIFKKRS